MRIAIKMLGKLKEPGDNLLVSDYLCEENGNDLTNVKS